MRQIQVEKLKTQVSYHVVSCSKFVLLSKVESFKIKQEYSLEFNIEINLLLLAKYLGLLIITCQYTLLQPWFSEKVKAPWKQRIY